MDVKMLIMNPVGRTILLIFLMALFAPMAGAINQWTLFTQATGVINSERVDRLVWCGASAAICADEDPDKLWVAADESASGASAAGEFSKLVLAATGCQVGATAASDLGAGMSPTGTIYTWTAAGIVNGCEWIEASSLFRRGVTGTIVKTLLSIAGLGLPIGALISLGQFGGAFVSQAGGGALLMSGVLLLVGLLLMAILGSSIIPFAGTALDSLDKDRYVMWGTDLGGLGTILGDFWAVALVGGVVTVGWQVISFYKNIGGNSGGSIFASGGGTDRM